MGTEIYVISIPTKKNKEFVAKFYKDRGLLPGWLQAKAYMGTMMWAEAVKKAGTTDINCRDQGLGRAPTIRPRKAPGP